MVEIPNFANVFAQSALAGRQVAQQRARQSALAMYGTDPVGAESALLAAGDVDTANALTQRRAAETRLATEQATLQRRRDVGSKVASGDLTGARTQALESGDLDLVGEIGKLDDAARKRVEESNAKIGGVAYNLMQIKDPAEREQIGKAAVGQLVQQGVLTEEQAAQVDLSDQSLQGYVSQALSLKDAIDRADKDRQFGLETEKFGHQKETDKERIGLDRQRVGMEGQRLGLERQRVQIARMEADNKRTGSLTPAQARKAETDLRKEFDSNPEVKSYRTIAQSAATVKQLASAPPTANNDIALIYSAMKAYDPNSVVRETEFATAQNAAGVPDKIRNTWNRVLNGQRLNPRQRAEIAASVNTVAGSAGRRFQEMEGQYRTYAQDYGVDPDRVAPRSSSGAADPLGIR